MNITLSSLPAAYINLDSRADLSTTFLEAISDLGYNNVTRYVREEDVEGKLFSGVMKSNKAVMAAMKASNSYPFTFFEDDVRGLNYSDTITVPDNADAVYLGLAVFGEGFEVTPVEGFPGVYKINKPIGLHSVLYITKRYIDAFEAALDAEISSGFANASQPINQIIQYPLAKEFNVYAVNPIFYKHAIDDPTTANLTRIVDITKDKIDPINFG